MPLYTTQGIFVYRGTQLDKQHIVHCAPQVLPILLGGAGQPVFPRGAHSWKQPESSLSINHDPPCPDKIWVVQEGTLKKLTIMLWFF